MATLVQRNHLVVEVNKRKRLGLYYRLAFVFLFIAIVAGLMASFHKMSKSIKKNSKQLETLQEELESYKMSQSKSQLKLNDDLKAVVQELKTMNLNLNNLKRSFDTQKDQVSKDFNQSSSMLTQIEKEVSLTVFGIKNQRDEMKLRLETLDNSHIELKQQLKELVSSVKDSEGKFEQISAVLGMLKNQTSKVLDVVEEQNNKTFFHVKEEAVNWNTSAVQAHEEITFKNLSLGNQTNQTLENSGKIMSNKTANLSSIIPKVVGNSTLVIMDEPMKEISQVKQEQKQDGGFTALLKKKATAVKEFVSKNVDNVIQKLKPSENLPNITIQAEETVNTTTKSKEKSATHTVAKGFSDVKKYVGDTLGSLFGKEKAATPEKMSNQTQNPQNLTTEKEIIKRGSESYMHLVWNDVLNISHSITGNDNEADKRAFLSLEPLFSELGLLSENMAKSASSGAWKKWHKGYETLKQAYEATKEMVKQEQNTSSKGFQKKFHKQVQKYLAKVNNLGQGQWF